MNVDIFSWPELNRNTACLDTMGINRHPIAYGATTDSKRDRTSWGCIATDLSSSQTVTTTAELQTTNCITAKKYPEDRCYSSQPYLKVYAPNSSARFISEVTLHGRGYSIVAASSMTEQGVPAVVI